MEVKEQPKLSFLGVDFVNVQYIATEKISNKGLDLAIAPKVHFPEDNKLAFSIIMDVSLKHEDKFNLTLLALGHFLVQSGDNTDLRRLFVNTNAPAIMFPYVRTFISMFTSNLGNIIGQINIPPQIFTGEIEEIKASPKEESKINIS